MNGGEEPFNVIYYYYFEEKKRPKYFQNVSTIEMRNTLNPFKCQLEPGEGFPGGESEKVRAEGINARFHIIYQSFFLFLIY